MKIHEQSRMNCGECRGRALTWSEVDVEVPYQDRSGDRRTAIARIPKGICDNCGASVYPYEALLLRHEAVCHNLGVLSPRQLIEGRKRLGMTQEQFAAHSGFGVASIRRWERGVRIQTVSSDRHLRALLAAEHPQTDKSESDSSAFLFKPRSVQSRRELGMRVDPAERSHTPPPKLPSFQDAPQQRAVS
jgi:transcriptional regulator with XRE-family HTH domain